LADEIVAQHYIDSGESIFFQDNEQMPTCRENLSIWCNSDLIYISKKFGKINLEIRTITIKAKCINV